MGMLRDIALSKNLRPVLRPNQDTRNKTRNRIIVVAGYLTFHIYNIYPFFKLHNCPTTNDQTFGCTLPLLNLGLTPTSYALTQGNVSPSFTALSESVCFCYLTSRRMSMTKKFICCCSKFLILDHN